MVPSKNALRVFSKSQQQIKLMVRQIEESVVGRPELASCDIEPPACKTNDRASFAALDRCRDLRRATEHGFDPCKKLPLIERLCEVVVGTEFKTDHTVRMVGHSRQHDDRNSRKGAQTA